MGYDIDFAGTKGGKTYNYGADMNNETDTGFMQNVEAIGKLFDAVYFAGGHGVMWDLAIDSISELITRAIYENNGVVGAIC